MIKEIDNKTLDLIKAACASSSDKEEDARVCMIHKELDRGIEAVKDLEASVTFYGGSRFTEGDEVYQKVEKLAYRVSKELGYTILSGGGGGVMEAASRGAYEADGKSIGMTIKLPKEQTANKYLSKVIPFHFFFARQLALSYTTEVCIFCPGGFGTMNELFELLTLKQTGKVDDVPIVLFGRKFWKPMIRIFNKIFLDKYGTISPGDLNIYAITDDEDEILKIIKSSKTRNGEDLLR